MNDKLDEELRLWVGRIGVSWAIPTDDVPKYLGRNEIENRVGPYPALGRAVRRTPIDLHEVEQCGKGCWALRQQFDAIRFGLFISLPESADALGELVNDFPKTDDDAARRIDRFIERCASLGYSDPKTGKLNLSSAALLASTVLTAALSGRFVDFRENRWKELADELEFPIFSEHERSTKGQMIVQAGHFAAEICASSTFRRFWPGKEPLWTIAGICWSASGDRGALRPAGVPFFPYEEDFDEGSLVLRSHLIHERSAAVVRKAKEYWRSADPLLRCEVCGFSFFEAYGEHGTGFIEAHHTKPIASLKAGARTRVADLVKVCSNCHRMLHVDNQCLELDALRMKLRK